MRLPAMSQRGFGGRSGAHAELGQDVRDVILDGPLGDAERVGDFLVAVAAGHQAQDLGLAIGQRIGPVEAGELVLHALEAGQQPLRDDRRDERAAGGDGLDRVDELVERDVLEEIAARAGLQTCQHELIVVECRQDDRRRQLVGRGQRIQHIEPRHARHAHVEQHDVGLHARNRLDGLHPVARLGDDADRIRQLQQRADTLPDQRLVVDETHFDHAAPSSGSQASSAKP